MDIQLDEKIGIIGTVITFILAVLVYMLYIAVLPSVMMFKMLSQKEKTKKPK